MVLPGHVPSDSFLAEASWGSQTRIIEFSCLTNAQTTTANNQDLLDVDGICSSFYNPALQVCLCVWGSLCLVPVDCRAREKSNISGILASRCLTLSIETFGRGSSGKSPRVAGWGFDVAEEGACAACKADGESHCTAW